MAVICITGTVSPRLQTIENILLSAGMQAPRPLPKDEPIDIQQWQRHVLASIDGESSGAIKAPGRLWELLAGEIVLANLKSPFWGWSDPASLHFLDFWQEFSPEFKFLLVCQSPQQLLAERVVNSDAPLNVAELLELWKSQHQEMLRFHHRNPERSLLIYAADAVAHPDLLVAECSKHWNLSLATAGIVTPSSSAPLDGLTNFFAYRVASLQPEIDALNREILATATIFAPAPLEDLTAEPQLEEILADYLALRQQLAEEEHKSRKEAERLQSELSEARDALIAQKSKDEARQVELQNENELLLLQLHQVQEELETVFLKEQESTLQIEVLKKEKSVAHATREEQARVLSERQTQLDLAVKTKNEQTKLANDRKVQIDLLNKEREQQTKQAGELPKQREALVRESKEQVSRLQAEMKEQQQENELLLLQLHQVQEELETVFLKEQESKQQIEALKGQKQTGQPVKSDELQQENELLLLQLHQVQEELERYFLQYQQIQQQYSSTRVSLHRLLEREPKFYDYAELEVSPGNRGDATPTVNCRLTNLIAAGRHFPVLAFSIAIEQGMAGLIFPAATVTTLLRPPRLAAGETELVISPVGAAEKLPATSDWSLVTTLIRLLNEALAQPQRLQWNSPLNSSPFLSGLQELERQMEPYDARLRYDEISLKREQVNPDYEHLWFEFTNLSFSGEIWPHFEFRLSCAHVRPDYFGGFPKLEFPAEGSQTPFEGWFIEASDDFGDKLELRFSLADKGLDLGVWERVTERDRAFIKALTAGLPQFLSTLQQSGVQIARSWEEWRTMAAEMQSVMTQCDTPLATIAEAPTEVQQLNVASAAGLRYDKAKLKREQVNPDYEHLWFEFANLTFSGESWPHFEFRLSCAHVRPDYFGGFPKLEFPAEGSLAPFEGWFIEANDDFGAKLELRFSLPDKALDLGVWERVTEHDRTFMKALVAELPQLLSTLQQSGVKIRRPWEDWTKMAVEMLPIVTNPPKLKGKKKSSFKKLLRRLQLAE